MKIVHDSTNILCCIDYKSSHIEETTVAYNTEECLLRFLPRYAVSEGDFDRRFCIVEIKRRGPDSGDVGLHHLVLVVPERKM